MSTPLNSLLYRRMRTHFGEVRIVNEGEEFLADEYCDPLNGNLRKQVLQAGEQYVVNCDICTDTRHRLYVSYLFGTNDEKGSKNLGGVKCFNETDCYSEFENRKKLYETLFLYFNQLRHKPKKQENTEPKEIGKVPSPGKLVPLEELPEDHHAIDYLLSRYFDPKVISRVYKVKYCERGDFFLTSDRLIIPSFQDRKLVGWQARLIGDPDKAGPNSPPKYWTSPGMHRRQVLYNLDRAGKWKTIVVVEGPTDVWNFGAMAVGIWGGDLSSFHKKLLVGSGAKSLVLLLDPEEMRKECKILKTLRGLSGNFEEGVATVCLPDNEDPGSLDRKWMREFVAEEAAKQKVAVMYERHSKEAI